MSIRYCLVWDYQDDFTICGVKADPNYFPGDSKKGLGLATLEDLRNTRDPYYATCPDCEAHEDYPLMCLALVDTPVSKPTYVGRVGKVSEMVDAGILSWHEAVDVILEHPNE